MKNVFRKTLFWLHLAFGIVAGLFIAILCATGAALAFEDEIIGWAEKEITRLEAPSENAKPLPIDDLVAQAKGHLDEESANTVSAIVAHADPEQAWKVQLGRRDFRYQNPYTGELLENPSTSLREGFRTILAWHRWLTSDRENRAVGKAITGAANLSFIGLGLTGLYLWFPKVWKWRVVRQVLLLKSKAKGKARDFNWHNVFGFWALLPILAMAVTGSVFSYSWARGLANSALGPSPSRQAVEQTVTTDTPMRGRPISLEQRFEIAKSWDDSWETISIPTRAGRNRGAGGGQGGAPAAGAGGHSHGGAGRSHGGEGGHSHGAAQAEGGGRGQGRPGGNQQAVSIKLAGDWFPLSPSRILIHPRSGEILGEDRSSDWQLNQKFAASIRSIHTGEAGLIFGKIIAFLGCLAGLILVYTGFALSWRRFFGKKKKSAPEATKRKEHRAELAEV